KVKEFQTYYGLKSTGIANKATLDKIKAVLASPLQKGKSHNDVIKLKQDLDTLGFKVVNNPNKYFGVQTEKQLKAFQKKHGLAISGIAEEVTLKKIESLLKTQSTDLKKGDNNPKVKKLKQDLAKLGFVAAPNPNGYFGVQTEKKVKEFQTYYGLKSTGIANKATLDKIKAVLASPLQKGKSHNDVNKLKQDLDKIGFKVVNNPNKNFGMQTEKQLKAFQKKHGLTISGIAEEVTLKKIEELIKNTKPTEKTEYTYYKLTLSQAVSKQLSDSIPQTDKYANKPAYVYANYIKMNGKAKISSNNVTVYSKPKDLY